MNDQGRNGAEGMETVKKIGVGVVGVGNMGLRHAKIYSQLEGVELLGLCDINEESLYAAKKVLGGKVFCSTSLTEFLGRNDIDAISICLPDNNHYESMMAAVGARKHILLEKPLADNYEQARRIAAGIEGYDRKVSVAHLLRFDPRYSGAYAALRRNEVGQVVYARCRRASVITGPRYYRGASTLPFHLAVHDIDLLNWFIGSEVQTVRSMSARRALDDLGVDDCVLTLLEYENGVIAQMEHSWIMPELYPPTLDSRMDIIGVDGMIELDLRSQGLSIFTDGKAEVVNTSYFFERHDGGISGCLIEQIRSFIGAIANDTKVAVTVDEGLKAVEIAEAIAKSARENTDVVLAN